MTEYLNENNLFCNKKIVKRTRKILLRYFPKDISNLIIKNIYQKCNNLRTLWVPYPDFKEYFYGDFKYEKDFEDEFQILSVNYDNKDCREWEYNISWKSYDLNVIGRIENINTSSCLAMTSCNWEPDISSDDISNDDISGNDISDKEYENNEVEISQYVSSEKKISSPSESSEEETDEESSSEESE